MSWREVVLSICRLPPSPSRPPGSPPRIFRAAQNYFTFRLITWAVAQAACLVGLFVAVLYLPQHAIALLILLVYFLQFFYSLAVLRLDYEMRWYMVSDRAIRIREGILSVREKTIALANIQNIGIRQGPLQRILGIADVEVRTAGGGSAASEAQKKSIHEPMHIAYFRGVDNAETIRDLVREGVRRQRNTGLGDPDEHHGDGLHDAVAMLLDEARKLRAVSAAL